MKNYENISKFFFILSIVSFLVALLGLALLIQELNDYRPNFFLPASLIGLSLPASISAYLICLVIDIAENSQKILFHLNPEDKKFQRSATPLVLDKQHRETYRGFDIYFGSGHFSVTGTRDVFDSLDEAKAWVREKTS